MKGDWIAALLFCGMLLLVRCSAKAAPVEQQTKPQSMAAFTRESRIEDVQNDPAFDGFAWLHDEDILPVLLSYLAHLAGGDGGIVPIQMQT